MEGLVFELAAGKAQALIATQNPADPPILPETGSNGWATQGLAVMPIAAGLLLLLAGTVLRRPAR